MVKSIANQNNKPKTPDVELFPLVPLSAFSTFHNIPVLLVNMVNKNKNKIKVLIKH